MEELQELDQRSATIKRRFTLNKNLSSVLDLVIFLNENENIIKRSCTNQIAVKQEQANKTSNVIFQFFGWKNSLKKNTSNEST